MTVEQALGAARAESLRVYLLEPSGDRLRMRAASPGAPDGARHRLARPSWRRAARAQAGGGTLTSVLAGTLWGGPAMHSALVAPLVAGDEVMGFLVARGWPAAARASEHERDLANSIAAQTARRHQADAADRAARRAQPHQGFFDDARRPARERLGGRARRPPARHRPPPGPSSCRGRCPRRTGAEAARPSCRPPRRSRRPRSRDIPGALVDRAEDSLRAARARRWPASRVLERIEAIAGRAAPAAAGGRRLQRRAADRAPCAAGFERGAAGRARPARPARTRARHLRYDELGVYKYLLRVPPGERVRDRHAEALRAPRRARPRGARRSCCSTLEEFLRQRGNVGATAQALYVHPTRCASGCAGSRTSRGLDARDDDWLMLEIALKLQRLEEVYPPGHHT